MIGIEGMSMPSDCWNCELIHENFSGLTICSLTGIPLYPMGSRNKRDEECPLTEIEEGGESDNE